MTATDMARTLTARELAAVSRREGDPISREYAHAVSAETARRVERDRLLARIPTWHANDDLFA
jgi:hypothetical protein